MAQKNRNLAAKAERAKRERRAFVEDMNARAACVASSDHIIVKAEHAGMRGTVRTLTFTPRKSIIALHW